jgi:hypothetical protein
MNIHITFINAISCLQSDLCDFFTFLVHEVHLTVGHEGSEG